MPFSEEPKSKEQVAKRSSNEYFKFTPDFRTVGRILNSEARTVWKHWLPQANAGRGMGAVCANTSPGLNICPIEQSVAHLSREDEERRSVSARRKFVVNILDRTPYTTCPTCNALTPGKTSQSAPGKFCIACGADLKGQKFTPLNKVKILEQGPNLFNKQLNPIEAMQKEELPGSPDITEYDITFTTQGVGRDRTITAIPQDPKPLEDDAFIDRETGEEQQLFSLEDLAEPPSIEELTLMMQGATIDQINALKGIE